MGSSLTVRLVWLPYQTSEMAELWCYLTDSYYSLYIEIEIILSSGIHFCYSLQHKRYTANWTQERLTYGVKDVLCTLTHRAIQVHIFVLPLHFHPCCLFIQKITHLKISIISNPVFLKQLQFVTAIFLNRSCFSVTFTDCAQCLLGCHTFFLTQKFLLCRTNKGILILIQILDSIEFSWLDFKPCFQHWQLCYCYTPFGLNTAQKNTYKIKHS